MERGKDRAGVGARGGSGNAHAQGRQGARSGVAGAGSAAVPALREAPGGLGINVEGRVLWVSHEPCG